MSEIHTTIVGNLTADPIARTSQVGSTFTTFRVASSVRRRQQDGSFADIHTNYVNVITFGALAQNVADSLHKGDPVIMTGRLRTNTYGNKDDLRISVDLEATSIGHDLARGRTRFAKGTLAAELDKLQSDEVQGALAEMAEGGVQASGRALGMQDGSLVDYATGEAYPIESVTEGDGDAAGRGDAAEAEGVEAPGDPEREPREPAYA